MRRFGIRPLRRWGQHFLVSARALERIVAAADLGRGDSVLEIGAGLGTLTAALAPRAGSVAAVEVDPRLVPALTAAVALFPNVRVLVGDALTMSLPALFTGPPGAARKVVANLPYNVAAPLLVRLIDPETGVERLVVTVQREVADRIIAAPATPAYGRLSLAVRFRGAARVVCRVPPGAFLPRPDVESAVVEIRPSAVPACDVPDEGELFRVIAAGFGQRRKTLQNALVHGLGLPEAAVQAACRASGADPRARAETLDLEAFAALARALHRDLAKRPGGGASLARPRAQRACAGARRGTPAV